MPENAENTFRGAVHSSAGSRAGEEAAGRNRRQEMRLPCDPGGVLLESVAHPEPVEGQIVEVSKSGLQLRLEIPVAFTNAGDSTRSTYTAWVPSRMARCEVM